MHRHVQPCTEKDTRSLSNWLIHCMNPPEDLDKEIYYNKMSTVKHMGLISSMFILKYNDVFVKRRIGRLKKFKSLFSK